MTAGRSNENGGRFAGGHFTGGHDGIANRCKPITAYDFHVRYNKQEYRPNTFIYNSQFRVTFKVLSNAGGVVV